MTFNIDGRTYITTAEYARRYHRDASGLRAAARQNRHGLGEAALEVDPRTKIYPLDLVRQWRKAADARAWSRRGERGIGDISRIAERYDLDRLVVWRAVKAEQLPAKRDEGGVWCITDAAAAAWAREWLGIEQPANPDA